MIEIVKGVIVDFVEIMQVGDKILDFIGIRVKILKILKLI